VASTSIRTCHRKIGNNESEFTKLTAHQNDEPKPKYSKPNWHPAKRALAGFVCQIQNMPFTGCFARDELADLVFLGFELALR